MSSKLVFILGSCRTGSTLLYQVIANVFDVFYFTNFINDNYYEDPSIGASIQKSSILNRGDLGYESNYGKTENELGTSEASNVFRNWFGGGHPSEIKSFDFLPNKREHMISTINSISDIMENRAIVSKNAWNIFRIKTICNAFPNSYFLHIRRDILDASLSSLNARRYRGDLNAWNTATPKNYVELSKLTPHQQVVEQHCALDGYILYNKPKARSLEIWYEDLCTNTESTLKNIETFLGTTRRMENPKLSLVGIKEISEGDRDLIDRYISERFDFYRYADINHNGNV